jgi:hypothetical protein
MVYGIPFRTHLDFIATKPSTHIARQGKMIGVGRTNFEAIKNCLSKNK